MICCFPSRFRLSHIGEKAIESQETQPAEFLFGEKPGGSQTPLPVRSGEVAGAAILNEHLQGAQVSEDALQKNTGAAAAPPATLDSSSSQTEDKTKPAEGLSTKLCRCLSLCPIVACPRVLEIVSS